MKNTFIFRLDNPPDHTHNPRSGLVIHTPISAAAVTRRNHAISSDLFNDITPLETETAPRPSVLKDDSIVPINDDDNRRDAIQDPPDLFGRVSSDQPVTHRPFHFHIGPSPIIEGEQHESQLPFFQEEFMLHGPVNDTGHDVQVERFLDEVIGSQLYRGDG